MIQNMFLNGSKINAVGVACLRNNRDLDVKSSVGTVYRLKR